MKRLIILTLGISLMAAACNKPVAVIDTPSTTANVESKEVAQAPVQSDTPTTQQPTPPASKPTLKAVGALVPKTDEEQDFQIDQNTIKNVEQDSRLDALESPVVVPTPTPLPTPTPTPPPDTVAPKVYIDRMVTSWLNFPGFEKNGGFYGTMGLWTDGISEDTGSGLAKVEYYLDGELAGVSTNIGNKIAWDTTKYSNGEHQLTVTAYDKAGNQASDSISITLKN